MDYNYTTGTTGVGKLCTCGAGLIQVQNFVSFNISVLMLSVKPFTPDKPPQQAMPQLWVASMFKVPASCLCPWQAARGASCPGLGVNSSKTCTTCQSLLTLTIWQGEKWSEEATPFFCCSLQPNDAVFLFPFRNPALSGALFCRVLSPL